MDKKEYCGIYDILKFIAALMIVLFHLWELLGLNNIYPISDAPTIYVELFFIISGFFLMSHIDSQSKEDDETIISYLLHKCKSFFGALCIVNAIHFVAYCKYNGINTIADVLLKLWHFKWEFLMLQCAGFIQNPQFNSDFLVGATWYLSAMMITQAIIYPLAKHYRKIFIRIICPLMILFVYGFMIQKYGTINVGKDITYLLPDSLYRAFTGQCLGVLSYQFYIWASKNEFFLRKEAIIIDYVCWLVFPLTIILTFSNISDGTLFCIIPFMYIVASASINKTPITKSLQSISGSISKKLGKLSLYIYLTHFPVICFVSWCFISYSLTFKIVSSLVITIVYTFLLYYLDKHRKNAYPIIVVVFIAIGLSLIRCLFI